MDHADFRKWAKSVADWSADYREQVGQRPVRPDLKPGDIAAKLPTRAPEQAESFDRIFTDFQELILPGMTHWQHPRFFAYFPANAAPASILAEMVSSTLAAQCMIWQTSPAAAELEGVTLRWLAQALGLPEGFTGVIQDTASSATLGAILTMRERALDWSGNERGLSGHPPIRIYASTEVHSSIDRAIWIAGIGQENLVKIPVTGRFRSMDPSALRRAIAEDRAAGRLPAGVILCVGGTSCGSTDNVKEIVKVAEEEGLFTHVDAAWAGSAMICPEFRHWWEGVERADSIVLNPHKWLGAQFDCSTHFLRDASPLLKTLAIHPEYLKTLDRQGFVDYSEMTIQLGRRFRALKLWFVLRAYGLTGLRERIANHVTWARELSERLGEHPDFEICTPIMLSLFTFRYRPRDFQGDLEELNQRLLKAINDDGRIYLSATKVDGVFLIRFQVGQFDTTREQVMLAADVIFELAATLTIG